MYRKPPHILPHLNQGMAPPSSELYDSLHNKTFYGLLIAEFLAAFNDQCIHAAAMFFAIRTQALSESVAISLMPLLFYTPWALFAPLSGYLADKYSKRFSLIFWKVAEVAITGVALVGFFLGVTFENEPLGMAGPWLVMSCVFLMGTHSAFYVPNKYGVLPEIFSVRALSKANGLIESTTFLAVILGTTCGGVLSTLFRSEEYWIGVILVGLALIGTLTSLLIRQMPPADPDRPFPGWLPWKLFAPLFKNLGVLLRYRLSTVAVLGLSFFTFMVAYMRATMYMFGESQNPPWSEQEISLMVAVVSLGVGVGSPLAGFISGGKVELGMVPVGALGMITALVLASLAIFAVPLLAATLVLIGLFASFYLVPLYSLLQYSAPKGSKGVSVATNNFIATTGAVLASLVFLGLVQLTHATGAVPHLKADQVSTGTLINLKKDENGHLITLLQVQESNRIRTWSAWNSPTPSSPHEEEMGLSIPGMGHGKKVDNIIKLGRFVKIEDEVAIFTYKIRNVTYYLVNAAEGADPLVYNNEELPRFLFLTAAGLLLVILLLLWRRLPDLFLRTLIWLRSLGRPFILVRGYENLPREPAILVTNCNGFSDSMYVVQAVVRPVRFLVNEKDGGNGGLLRLLAGWAGLQTCEPGAGREVVDRLAAFAASSLRKGYQVAVNFNSSPETSVALVEQLRQTSSLPVIPIACRPRRPDGPVELIIGPPLPPETPTFAIRETVEQLTA